MEIMVTVQEVGVDENNNPTLAFTYKGKGYMGIANAED